MINTAITQEMLTAFRTYLLKEEKSTATAKFCLCQFFPEIWVLFCCPKSFKTKINVVFMLFYSISLLLFCHYGV